MSFLPKIIYPLLLLPLIALTGCVNDGLEPCPDTDTTPAGYLELTVTTGGTTGSRANPTGGETGDGLEHGRNNENTIHNLSLFVYADGGEGLDGNNYTIIWKKYIDQQDLIEADPNRPINPVDQIYNIRIPLEEADFDALRLDKGTLRALVVANANNITYNKNSVKDICYNVEFGSAWSSEGRLPENADNFVMSSAFNGAKNRNNDGLIRVANTETDGTIYSTEVTLERVAARIDLQFTEKNIVENEGGLYYDVINSDNKLIITNVFPVNLMQKSSYLVKHVSKPDIESREDNCSEENILVAGDETSNEISQGNKLPTNYVITPQFFDKPNNNNTFEEWYKNTRADYYRTAIDKSEDLVSPYILDADMISSRFTPEGEAETTKAIVISYANENTHHKEVQKSDNIYGYNLKASDYLTGLLLRVQYKPAKLYTTAQVDENAPTVEYKANEWGIWPDFWMFRPVSKAVEEKYNLYFASEAALNAYIKTLPAGGEYETQKYERGICYYNIWIKHANIDGSDENFPMKYGIVRNNIYRISLNFNGIGQPTPEITEPYNITTRIYVIKWNFRPQPEIIM